MTPFDPLPGALYQSGRLPAQQLCLRDVVLIPVRAMPHQTRIS